MKLDDVEGKEQYGVEISNGFAALKTETLRWILTDINY
jgi:hypothetical protein